MKQTAFSREKNGEYRACLKYSVPIFVEQIYKMQRLEVSSAVRPLYGSLGVKRLRSFRGNLEPASSGSKQSKSSFRQQNIKRNT